MKLLNEIIEAATTGSESVANLLRKCLVLSFELKNDKLKTWVEGELNGYGHDGNVPDYRRVHLNSKGNFQGPFGAWIPERPLPMSILDKEHRKFLDPRLMTETIASYESFADKKEGSAVINWPADLIVKYQEKFIKGYALAQAWQELPSGLVIGIVDTVKSRILRFALEIREELGSVSDNPAKLPPAKVEAAVNNYIFGGNNVIAGVASDFTQIGSIQIGQGDLGAFTEALQALGIGKAEAAQATALLIEDGKPADKSLGEKMSGWLQTAGEKLGGAGLKVGTEAVKQVVTKWALQYWGLG